MRAFFVPLLSLQDRVSSQNTVQKKRLRGELPSLLVLGLVPAISSLGMSLHVPTLNDMAQYYGQDQFSVQSVISLYMLAFGLAIFATAFLADLVGKRKILVISLLLSALASIMAATASQFEVLLLARILQAFAAGFIVVMPYAILQEMLSGRALFKAIAFVSVLHSVASASAPLIGGLFAQAEGFRGAFGFMAIYALVMLCCVSRSVKSVYTRRRKAPALNEIRGRALRLVSDRQFLSCMTLLSFSSALYYGFLSVASLLMITQYKLSGFVCGFVLFVLCGFWPLGNRLSAIWVEKYGLIQSLHLALLLIFAGLIPLVLFSSTQNLLLIVASMIPYMVGAGVISPLVVSAATKADPGLSGLSSSLLFAGQVLFGAFTAWFFGFFDLSCARDLALFGLFTTMVSYMAIGFMYRPMPKRTVGLV